MNKKSLVKIIKREVSILADVIDGFEDGESIHPMEVDLALSKAKDIYDELLLLKPGSIVLEEPELKPELKSIKEDKKSEPELLPKELIDEKIVEQAKPEPLELKDTQPEMVSESATESVQWPEVLVENTIHNIEVPESEVEEEEAVVEETTEIVLEELIEENIEKIDVEDEVEEVKSEKVEKPIESDDLPIDKEIVVNSKEESTNENGAKSVIVADKFSKNALSLNDMLAGVKQNKDLASLLKESPIVDLKRAIKVNDRIWFINELFNKNSASFDKTIEKVNSSADLDKALEYIFTNYKWDQERKSTISFLELVFRRFASK